MKANPRHPHFREVIGVHASEWLAPWEGDCWRFQSIEFPAPKQILSGEGAWRSGGRLNVKDSFPVVYGSAADETALKESAARAKRYGLTVRKPRILVSIHLKLRRVLDLSQPTLRRRLGITLSELREEDWEKLQYRGIESLGQALGRAAMKAKAEAVIIPAFAHRGGTNIAFFPGNKDPLSTVKIWEESKLPTVPGNSSGKRK